MSKPHISTFFRRDITSHADIDFVDLNPATDTKLFIDPCLIKTNRDEFCVNAQRTIDSYFDNLYGCYKLSNDSPEIDALLQHTRERNEARLGYGNGRNGKGRTPEEMKRILADLHTLINNGIHMESPIDLSLFLYNFAEDCMSDMLVNILYKDLSEFTLQQCTKYGIETCPSKNDRYYWDTRTSSWQLYTGNWLQVDGKPLILMPKQIMRKRFYYNTAQYFSSMIVSRLQADQTEYIEGKKVKPHKKDITKTELEHFGSMLAAVRHHTLRNPAYLSDHHKQMESAYTGRGMSDDELDEFIYG